jgi:RAB6A-GEF complex partner protein 1
MYWPIGAPRVYAASKLELSVSPTHANEDECAAPVLIPVEKSKSNGPSEYGEVGQPLKEDGSEDDPERKSKTGSKRQGAKQALSEDYDTGLESEEGPGGEILGLRISRGGQIFATITRSTLTIWQTKVTLPMLKSLSSRS